MNGSLGTQDTTVSRPTRGCSARYPGRLLHMFCRLVYPTQDSVNWILVAPPQQKIQPHLLRSRCVAELYPRESEVETWESSNEDDGQHLFMVQVTIAEHWAELSDPRAWNLSGQDIKLISTIQRPPQRLAPSYQCLLSAEHHFFSLASFQTSGITSRPCMRPRLPWQ